MKHCKSRKKPRTPTPLTPEQRVQRIEKAIRKLGDAPEMWKRLETFLKWRPNEILMHKMAIANLQRQVKALSVWRNLSGAYTEKKAKHPSGIVYLQKDRQVGSSLQWSKKQQKEWEAENKKPIKLNRLPDLELTAKVEDGKWV